MAHAGDQDALKSRLRTFLKRCVAVQDAGHAHVLRDNHAQIVWSKNMHVWVLPEHARAYHVDFVRLLDDQDPRSAFELRMLRSQGFASSNPRLRRFLVGMRRYDGAPASNERGNT